MKARRSLRKDRMPLDNLLLAGLAAASFVGGVIGFYQQAKGTGSLSDAVYQSLQLFFLNFDVEPGPNGINNLLQFARFGAFATVTWTLTKALFPHLRQRARRGLRAFSRNCVLLLGYGPVGQAIAAALRQDRGATPYLTAVHKGLTPEQIERAEADGVLLVEGDPSDPQILTGIHAARARRIFVSDQDDLQAIDTAVALRRFLGDERGDIRVVLEDGAVSAQMAEAADAGFAGATNIRWFSTADEIARRLIADARPDRVAVESHAPQMHLVILGCGVLGEAVTVEALLTGWRHSLGPPRLTFIDDDIGAAEARLRRRMPAWFRKEYGNALPAAARPLIRFVQLDARQLDFSHSAELDEFRQGVTGWVLATGDAGLNLRASLSLYGAMMSRHTDPAPIHVRVVSGHGEDVPDIANQPLTMVSTFGAIDATIAGSSLIASNPDRLPRSLHAAYDAASIQMGLQGRPQSWQDLPETKRSANRALFRHSVMKIEDFGLDSHAQPSGRVRIDPGLAAGFARVDQCLDYARISRDTPPEDWFRDGTQMQEGDADRARQLLAVALCEHNRWTAARMLERFIPTDKPDPPLRDDTRRLHDNMHDWFSLPSAEVRRFDVVMLRALVSGDDGAPVTHPTSVMRLFLPVSRHGKSSPIIALDAMPQNPITELHLGFAARHAPACSPALIGSVLGELSPYLDPVISPALRRLRIDFHAPPQSSMWTLANALADAISRNTRGRVTSTPHFAWKSKPGKTVGVFGHRDLDDFIAPNELAHALRQCFVRLVAEEGIETLVCGYAAGADQLAVEVWNSIGLKPPDLVFPYYAQGTDDRIWWTDQPKLDHPGTGYSTTDLADIGRPHAANEPGHVNQAMSVIHRSDILIAIVDRNRNRLSGGALDSLAHAMTIGKPVFCLKSGAAGSMSSFSLFRGRYDDPQRVFVE